MSICSKCQQEVSGNFCSQCGTLVVSNYGLSLLRHIESRLGVDRKHLERHRKALEREDNHKDFQTKRIAELERTIAKWEGWQEFVTQALSNNSGA